MALYHPAKEASTWAASCSQLSQAEISIRCARNSGLLGSVHIELDEALWTTLRGTPTYAELLALLDLYQPMRGSRTLQDAHELTNDVMLEPCKCSNYSLMAVLQVNLMILLTTHSTSQVASADELSLDKHDCSCMWVNVADSIAQMQSLLAAADCRLQPAMFACHQ